jgi:hypothetical protein
MLPMYCAFENDRSGDHAAISRVRPGWPSMALVCQFLAKRSGIQISPQTMERWLRMWAWIFLMDKLIDESPLESRPEARRFLEELLVSNDPAGLASKENADLVSVLALFNSSMLELEPIHQRERFTSLALKMADQALEKASATHVLPYAKILLHEGKLAAVLAATCLNARELKNRRAFRRFLGDFALLLRAAFLADHSRDFENDFEEARTLISPTPLRRGFLLACSGPQVVPVLVSNPRVVSVMLESEDAMKLQLANLAARVHV